MTNNEPVFIFIFYLFSLSASEHISNCSISTDPGHHGILVDCSYTNLTDFPPHLPENTTYLDLSHNHITAVTKHFLNLTNLWYLDVSFNKISKLEPGAFQGVWNLRELYLNDNDLSLNYSSYPKDVFLPLKNLLKLHIHGNDHSRSGSYPEDAIGILTQLVELKIDTFPETIFGKGFSSLKSLQRLLLGFEFCKLSSVENDTFKAFENTTVKTLDLQYCPIHRIENNAFGQFNSLENLILSNCIYLSPAKVMSVMYGLRGKRLNSLLVNNIFQLFSFRVGLMNQRILGDGDLKYLADMCVERFEMVKSKVAWISATLFKGTQFSSCIRFIDLSYNDLMGDQTVLLGLSLMPNLESVNVSKHCLMQMQTKDMLQDLCDGNSFHVAFSLPPTLKFLNVRCVGQTIGCVSDIVFHNGTNLTYADFSYLGTEGVKSKIIGRDKLTHLDLSGNNFVSAKSLLLAVPKLETLIMSDVSLPDNFLLSTASHTVPLKELSVVSLNSNNLKILTPYLFRLYPVRKIDLSNNKFERILIDLTSTPFLCDLDLSFNSLAVLSDTEMELLDDLASKNNLTLNLEGNILSCGCKNLDLVRWLYTTNVHWKLWLGDGLFCRQWFVG